MSTITEKPQQQELQQGSLILITGGARSGKSTLAEKIAQDKTSKDGKVIYLATATVYDKEMEKRVDLHRQRRPDYWITVEEPIDMEKVIAQWDQPDHIILIDCLTLWLTNLILPHYPEHWSNEHEEAILERAKQVALQAKKSLATIIVVGNEVGMGIVPVDPLSRIFRDLSGLIQQAFAKEADQVFLTVSGYPLQVK
ncbi:bifunctional adenosylcobinamide kinase/adenosylcobinamide-phosphate guanylyltransferase [Heliorestis acidaminivorans]|uniref:bifunctional adenosylcobinamide kinase/adenosylcobinamide-phosphate guanylyltransferase n=1 Tax=Heliorestis acidaminivorans TaxID=553427 RepID=UPI001FA9A206|nr:bifunctional adenosylcobinamide kinase/adenosylcobinamide-phosphate guanylyltransferase [Heliorestis acidaminivorans]